MTRERQMGELLTQMGELLTAQQLADHLGHEPWTILKWTREGVLPGFRLPSGQLRYRMDEVESWLEERRTTPVRRLEIVRRRRTDGDRRVQ